MQVREFIYKANECLLKNEKSEVVLADKLKVCYEETDEAE